jgi:hypothetical protein
VSIRALCEVERKDEDDILNYPIMKIYRILEFEKDRAGVMNEIIKAKK